MGSEGVGQEGGSTVKRFSVCMCVFVWGCMYVYMYMCMYACMCTGYA